MKKFGKFLSLCLTLCMLATMVAGFSISTVSAESTELPKYVNNDGNKITTVSSTSQGIWSKLNQTVVEGRPLFEQGGYLRNTKKELGTQICIADGWVSEAALAEKQCPIYLAKDKSVYCDSAVESIKNTAAWSRDHGKEYMIWDGYVYDTTANQTLGTRFNVPYSGKIKVTYQLANGAATMNNGEPDGGTLSVGSGKKENAAFLSVGKGDMGLTWSYPSNDLREGGNYGVIKLEEFTNTTVKDFLTLRTMEIDVTAGESVYFMINPADGSAIGTSYFYINSVEYTEMRYNPSTATVIGHNIATLENPVVRFYVKYSEKPVGDFATIKIGNDAETIVFGTSAAGIIGPDGRTELTEDDYVQIYSIAVPAKRMTETITISIKNSDGVELLTEKNTYSVSEYCTAQVKAYKDAGEAATADQLAVAKICTQILAYGKSAQKFFQYNLDNLPVIDEDVYDLVVADVKN
ncbi:MAG TPA: hypothetical protein DDW30_05490 [Clostridiales bacterium]|nr:hypothetical protein [Clostridiales bacterium]